MLKATRNSQSSSKVWNRPVSPFMCSSAVVKKRMVRVGARTALKVNIPSCHWSTNIKLKNLFSRAGYQGELKVCVRREPFRTRRCWRACLVSQASPKMCLDLFKNVLSTAGRTWIVHSARTLAHILCSCRHYYDGSHLNGWTVKNVQPQISLRCYLPMKINISEQDQRQSICKSSKKEYILVMFYFGIYIDKQHSPLITEKQLCLNVCIGSSNTLYSRNKNHYQYWKLVVVCFFFCLNGKSCEVYRCCVSDKKQLLYYRRLKRQAAPTRHVL